MCLGRDLLYACPDPPVIYRVKLNVGLFRAQKRIRWIVDSGIDDEAGEK